MAKGQALGVQLSPDFSFSLREEKGDGSTGDTTRLQSPAVPTIAAESQAKKPSTPSRAMVPFPGMKGLGPVPLFRETGLRRKAGFSLR